MAQDQRCLTAQVGIQLQGEKGPSVSKFTWHTDSTPMDLHLPPQLPSVSLSANRGDADGVTPHQPPPRADKTTRGTAVNACPPLS